jgi:2,4-dienoyl-CoA reductase-like NADH-dependent reductase (Old Yellow Enzyme family)
MTDFTSQILSPYDRNGIAVRNRVAVAPMTRIGATEYGYLRERRQSAGVIPKC